MRDIRPHLVADSWSYTESVQVYFILSIVLLEREGRGEGEREERESKRSTAPDNNCSSFTNNQLTLS